MINRRDLLSALALCALAAPLCSFAQQSAKVRRIAFLWEIDPSGKSLDAFKAGLRELGYAEGRDYVVDQRSARSDLALLPTLAAELVSLKVDLIVAPSTPAAMAARNATRETPILVTQVGDPVGSGLAASLRRPGGNVTGLTNLSADLTTKHLDLLRQVVPGMRRVGYLYNPDNAANVVNLKALESECGKLEIKCIRAPVRELRDVAIAFGTLRRDKAQALLVSGANTHIPLQEIILQHATRYRLPAIFLASSWVEAGGLISYASSTQDRFRQAAAYADKIFKGTRPGDLPIQQPTKFDLVINLRTATQIGLKIPQSVLARADRVIE